MPATSKIDGDNLLYSYWKSDLSVRKPDVFEGLVADMLNRLSVWLSPDLYTRLPILIPYAARDPDSRGNKKKGIPDQWGSPTAEGVFRDDNSLLKRLPASLSVRSPDARLYSGGLLGNGFVAAHVWAKDPVGRDRTTRNRLTYSFVPNVVWVPRQLAKLTDVEGGFAQKHLQALSSLLYRKTPTTAKLAPFVAEPWNTCALPQDLHDDLLPPDAASLNTFAHTDRFVGRRIAKIRQVADAIQSRREGRAVAGKVISRRYTEGLAVASPASLGSLGDWLSGYLEALSTPT